MKRGFIAFLVILVLAGIIYSYPRYKLYNYFKSELFQKTANQFYYDYQSYVFTYNAKPKKVSDFISFHKKNKKFLTSSELSRNMILYKYGIIIDSTTFEDKIVFASKSNDKKQSSSGEYIYSDSLNFWKFLFSTRDVYITYSELLDPCNRYPRRISLLKDSSQIINDEIINHVYKLIGDFNQKKFKNRLRYNIGERQTHFFLCQLNGNNLEFSLQCDPYEKNEIDYTSLYQELDSLLRDIITGFQIEQCFFPLKIDSTHHYVKGND